MSTVNLQDMLAQYKNEEVSLLPEGEYTLEVTRCTVKDIKNGEGLMPIYKVIGGPEAGKTAMLGTISLTENSANIFFRTMKGFGLDKDFFATVGTLKEVAPLLVGRIIKAQIGTRPWKGEDRNQFASIGSLSLESLGASDGSPQGLPPAAPVAAAPVAAEPVVAAPAQAPPPLPAAPADAPPTPF